MEKVTHPQITNAWCKIMMLFQRLYSHVSQKDGKCPISLLPFADNTSKHLETLFLFHCGLTIIVDENVQTAMSDYMQVSLCHGKCFTSWRISHYEEGMHKTSRSTPGPKMRDIAVPSIIQNVFWASPTCEWLPAAREAFSDGWVFGKPVYMIPCPMKQHRVIPELFLLCEYSLRNWTEIIRLFTRDFLRGRQLFIHTFYNFKMSFWHFLLSSLK